MTLAQTVFEIFEIACTDKWVLRSQSVSLALQIGGNEPSEYHSVNNHAKYCDDSFSLLDGIRVFALFKMAAWKLTGNSWECRVPTGDHPCKFGDSSSNRFRDIRGAEFVTDGDDGGRRSWQ